MGVALLGDRTRRVGLAHSTYGCPLGEQNSRRTKYGSGPSFRGAVVVAVVVVAAVDALVATVTTDSVPAVAVAAAAASCVGIDAVAAVCRQYHLHSSSCLLLYRYLVTAPRPPSVPVLRPACLAPIRVRI